MLSPEQTRTLAAVLDEVIPPREDGALPGAGELGLAAQIEAAIENAPDLGPAVTEGVAAADRAARARGSDDFAALPRAERAAVLNEIAPEQPAFLGSLIFQTYTRYYAHPRVLEALGVDPRPPFPEGYELEAGDLSLLDPVRGQEGPRYRRV